MFLSISFCNRPVERLWRQATLQPLCPPNRNERHHLAPVRPFCQVSTQQIWGDILEVKETESTLPRYKIHFISVITVVQILICKTFENALSKLCTFRWWRTHKSFFFSRLVGGICAWECGGKLRRWLCRSSECPLGRRCFTVRATVNTLLFSPVSKLSAQSFTLTLLSAPFGLLRPLCPCGASQHPPSSPLHYFIPFCIFSPPLSFQIFSHVTFSSI